MQQVLCIYIVKVYLEGLHALKIRVFYMVTDLWSKFDHESVSVDAPCVIANSSDRLLNYKRFCILTRFQQVRYWIYTRILYYMHPNNALACVRYIMHSYMYPISYTYHANNQTLTSLDSSPWQGLKLCIFVYPLRHCSWNVGMIRVTFDLPIIWVHSQTKWLYASYFSYWSLWHWY